MSEADIQAEIILRLSRDQTRLFRTQAGSAWAGTIIERTHKRLVLIDYRPVRLGMPGISDLCGFSPLDSVAVYTAVECKAPKGRVRPEQQGFIDMVLSLGGRAGIARSVADAQQIIRMEVRK